MGSKPKEDPDDKAARLRERRLSNLERTRATQSTAKGLTTDIQSVYGGSTGTYTPGATVGSSSGLPSLFGLLKK